MGQTLYLNIRSAYQTSQQSEPEPGEQLIVFPGPGQTFNTIVYTYDTPNCTVSLSPSSQPQGEDKLVFTGDLSRVHVEWEEDRIADIIVDGVSLLHGVGPGTALKCSIPEYETLVAEAGAWLGLVDPWVDTHCLCPKLPAVDYTRPVVDSTDYMLTTLPGKSSFFLFDSQFLYIAQYMDRFPARATSLEILRVDFSASGGECSVENFSYQHPHSTQYENSCFNGLPKVLSVGNYLYVACVASDMVDRGEPSPFYAYSVWLLKIDKSSMEIVSSRFLTDYLEPIREAIPEEPPSLGSILDVSFIKLDDDRLFVLFEYSRDGSGYSKRGYAIFVIDTDSLSVVSHLVGDIEDDAEYYTRVVGLRASLFYDSSSECWRFLAASFGERLYRMYDSVYRPTPGTYMTGRVAADTSEITLDYISVPPEGGWTQDYWNALLDLSYYTDLVSFEIFAVPVPGGK